MHNATGTVVGIGEALVDRFEERVAVGGAPANFAVHAQQILQRHGVSVAVVSRVGADPAGRSILDTLRTFGVSTNWIQHDPNRQTGVVDVKLDREGCAEYEIHRDVAWDSLEWNDELERFARTCRAVCFGSLAQRSDVARHAIRAFLQAATHALRLFDVNLRRPMPSEEVLRTGFQLATIAKMNESELPQVCQILRLGIDGDPARQLLALQDRFKLQMLVLTRGKDGTSLFANGAIWHGDAAAFPPAADADSVGAGDACSAGVIVGLLLGLPLHETVSLANRVGAYVASSAGATPPLPDSVAFVPSRRGSTV